jgi:hypothetical protein
MKVSVKEVGGSGKQQKQEKKREKGFGYKLRAPHHDENKTEDDLWKESEAGEGNYTETGRIKYVNPLSLGIEEWAPDEIPLDSFVICFGKRRTGKSFFTRDFFHRVKGKFWHVNVYTGTKHNGFYQEFMDDKFIIKGFQPQGLRNLLDVQEHLKECQFLGEIPKEADVYAMVWLDDVINGDDIRHSEEFNTTATMGRHFDLTVGVNTQHVTGIPPVIRVNADIVVIFTQLNWAYKKQLAEEYLGMLNPRTAMELIDYYTRDHGCLIIELWRNDADPKVLIHYYKAAEPPAFSVHKQVPQYIEDELKHRDIDGDSDEDDVDIAA